MSNVQSGECPLCGSAAQVENHTMKRSKHYVCSSCGELVIKQFAESWLQTNASPEAKHDFAERAKKCPEGSVYFMSQSQGTDGSKTLSGKCLPLAEALKL